MDLINYSSSDLKEMLEIKQVPSTIVISCGFADRISREGRYATDMRIAFDDEVEFLEEYKDFDMELNFVVRFKNCNTIGLGTAFCVLEAMEEVRFCGCFSIYNTMSMTITDDYCLFDIDTESG